MLELKESANGVAFVPLPFSAAISGRSEEHTSELQSRSDLVCRLLLEKKKKRNDRSQNLNSALLISQYIHTPPRVSLLHRRHYTIADNPTIPMSVLLRCSSCHKSLVNT